MQDIIVLDYLLNQTKKQKMDLMVVNRVNNELQNLNKLRKQGYGKVIDYLRNQNGKQLKGAENL